MIRALALLAAVAFAAPAAAQIHPAAATPEARASVTRLASCIARSSPGLSRSFLTMDFTSKAYGKRMLALNDVNRDCYRTRGRMRAASLPFAAALAEAMLARDASPLNVRLLKAARTEAPTFAPSDRVAMCVARSDPDGTATLLQSAPSTAAEIAAAARLNPAVTRCTPANLKLELTPYALRAITATASFRLLEAAK